MGKFRTCGTQSEIIGCVSKPIKSSRKSSSGYFEDTSSSCDGNNSSRFKRTKSDPEWRAKRRLLSVTIYALSLSLACFFGSVDAENGTSQQGPQTNDGRTDNGSRIDEGSQKLHQNCSPSSANDFPADLFSMEQKRHGAVIIHFVVSVYLFYALLLVCDEYFVPSVESICKYLKIPSDVAGATFMAVSTSAPELFTNVIGTFVTKGDLGVGTIVGSAVFNILIVAACCGLGAGYSVSKLTSGDNGDKKGLRLEWWPLTRDSLFYLISVGALIMILSNRKVHWAEALLMIAIYGLYVIVLCYNTKCQKWTEKFIGIFYKGFSNKSADKEPTSKISIVVSKACDEKTPLLFKENGSIKENNNKHGFLENGLNLNLKIPAESMDQILIRNALSESNSYSTLHQVENCWGWCKLPENKNWKTLTEYILSLPIRFALWLTIPDCRLHKFRKWYWITLIMCVTWIGVLTYVISWMVTIIGATLSIPDSVTGLTFLAAGTSIPEVISSLIVARQGLGAMAFSNTVASNTFDILVCLGLPWLIETAILTSGSSVSYIEIHSGGLEYSAVILISALVLLYLFLACNGFILDRKIGFACALMYIIFITFSCMLEMNVFFPVNLPTCQ